MRAGVCCDFNSVVTKLAKLCDRLNVDMPICQAVETVLTGEASVSKAVNNLLARPFKAEAVD